LKKGIVLVLFAIVISPLYAQRSEVIASGSDYFKTNTGSISWTLGELSIETYSSQNKILTQGFQQTFIKNAVTGITETVDLGIEVYPNPAEDRLYLRVLLMTGMSYTLLDLSVGQENGSAPII